VAYEPETGTFLVGQAPMWRPRSYGDGTAEAIDHAVKALIETAFRTAFGILERNRPILEASARELLLRETLGPEDLGRLTAKLDREGRTRPALAAVP
jgi:cell division protease FtsH